MDFINVIPTSLPLVIKQERTSSMICLFVLLATFDFALKTLLCNEKIAFSFEIKKRRGVGEGGGGENCIYFVILTSISGIISYGASL